MNLRKEIDYTALFDAVDRAVSDALTQMELYREIGRMVAARPEKGAAVAVAEYLQSSLPESNGFSPRNLRRMRDFSRFYEGSPETMQEAMKLGWTQNVVILEADLTLEQRGWYIRAALKNGWSKQCLAQNIAEDLYAQENADENANLPDVPSCCNYTSEQNTAEDHGQAEQPMLTIEIHAKDSLNLLKSGDRICSHVTTESIMRKSLFAVKDSNSMLSGIVREWISGLQDNKRIYIMRDFKNQKASVIDNMALLQERCRKQRMEIKDMTALHIEMVQPYSEGSSIVNVTEQGGIPPLFANKQLTHPLFSDIMNDTIRTECQGRCSGTRK